MKLSFAMMLATFTLALALDADEEEHPHPYHLDNMGCSDCRVHYDTCIKTADVAKLWCEKICKKRACQLNDVCKTCDNKFYDCEKLDRFPHPTVVVEEKSGHRRGGLAGIHHFPPSFVNQH